MQSILEMLHYTLASMTSDCIQMIEYLMEKPLSVRSLIELIDRGRVLSESECPGAHGNSSGAPSSWFMMTSFFL